MGKPLTVVFLIGMLWTLPAAAFSQAVHKAWVRQYPDADTCAHGYSAMVVDSAGNVYVAGAGRLPGHSDYDFLTKKISPSGLTLWEARYDGPVHDDDRAADLRVDKSGNVYVTGNSVGAGAPLDFATVKYDANGIQQWVARKAGPGRTINHVYGLGIGENGDIVVFGYTEDTSGFQIGEIVKYESSGNELWTVLDTVYGKVGTIDRLGNVYVVGSGYGYSTIKIDPQGLRQWRRLFEPVSASFIPSSLDIDETGGVYVSGTSFDFAFGDAYTWIVKYNSAGIEQWSKSYLNAGVTSHLILDSTLVYVSARSRLVCLTRDGGEQWNIPCDQDSVFDIVSFVLNKTSELVVLGSILQDERLPSASYSRSGSRLWAHRCSVPDTLDPLVNENHYALDPGGDSFLCLNSGSTTRAPVLERFDNAGRFLWGEPAQYTKILGMVIPVVDGSGNVFVTGETYSPGTLSDILTIKYDSSGVPVWGARYNGPADSVEEARAIALDPQGNVYVTGQSTGLGTGLDVVTIKYNSSGEKQWEARYNGPASSTDVPSSMAVDSLGYVYVTGWSRGAGGSWDFATQKYTPAGLLQWVNRYDGPSGGDDRGLAIAVDDLRNVYVTGQSDSLGSGTDFLTIKYDAFGQQQWVRRYSGPANGSDVPLALAITPAGDVIVTGYSDGLGTQVDYETVQYDPTGALSWSARFDDSLHSIDIGKGMARDKTGNIFVTGSSTGGGNAEDYLTLEYDANGNMQWVVTFDGSGHGTDIPTTIAVDDSGNVYVAGKSYSASASYDLVTIKYDHFGNEIWRERYGTNSANSQGPGGLKVDRFGNVYLAAIGGYGIGDRWTIVKYAQSPALEVAKGTAALPGSTMLWQNYPNPFNPITVVGFRTSVVSRVRLVVYDLLGREVETLVDEVKTPGKYSVTWDASRFASGVYFYTMSSGQFRETRKFLLIK